MIFSSYVFLYLFLPAFFLTYSLVPRRFRSLTIAVFSYVFYGWWRPDFVLLMLFSTVVDYSCGKGIVRDRRLGQRGRRFVWLSCLVNLGLLGWFKYANFGVETLNRILVGSGSEPLTWEAIVLPVGISFYTFQTMSYTIDVYRKKAPPVRHFTDFMCYVALFPQLIAGPIVRYGSVALQLQERTHSLKRVYQGILLFQIGFAKKILIADNVAPLADGAFSAADLGTAQAWIGVVAYALQIYFDFSGYSDMALGIGSMIGFRFPINFNQPYKSVGITDFWRRWHISLSSWLRDYLYIPLGGNRRGPLRTYVNLSATMLLGGLWHGANWTFVIWGAYQGFWLAVERRVGKRSLYWWAPKPFQIACTFVMALVGWVFFRADGLGAAIDFLGAMFSPGSMALPGWHATPLHYAVLGLGLLLVFAAPPSSTIARRAPAAFALLLQPVFLAALVHLHYQDHTPFIYYQF